MNFETIKTLLTRRRKSTDIGHLLSRVLHIENPIDDYEGFNVYQVARAHPWVFAGIRALVNNLAGVEYHFYKPVTKKSGARGWEIDEKHPWEKVLRAPNKFMSGYDLMKFHFLSLEYTSKSFWLLEKDALGEPTEINILPPHLVKVIPGKEELIAGFEYEYAPGKKLFYKYEDVLYFRTINSVESLIDSLPGLVAAKDSIMTDLFASAWNKVYFKNAQKVDGIITIDGPVTEEQQKRNLAAWESLYKGVDKAHKIAIMGGGKGKFQDLSRNLKDMDFIQLSKMKREEILGALNVPPFVVGIREDASYANADAQMRVFWELTLDPKQKEFASTMNLRVNQLMKGNTAVFQADLSNVRALQQNELQRAQTAQIYTFMGIPLNDVINKLDLPFDPVEERPARPAEPAQTEEDPEEEGSQEDPAQEYAGQDDPEKRAAAPVVKVEESMDEVVKRMRWNSFDRSLRMHEPKFEAGMKAFFRLQRGRVLRRLRAAEADLFPKKRGKAGTKAGDDPAFNEMGDVVFQLIWLDEYEKENLARTARKFIRGIYADFAMQAIRDNELPISFNLQDPAVVQFVESKVMKLVREASGTTRESISEEVVEAVRAAVAEGLSASETIAQISDRIDGVYQFAQEYRSTLIARTETISAANSAGYDMLGRVGAKVQWLTSRDGKVRDTHQLLEGQVRPHGEPFVTAGGAQLMYPGDPAGPPEEIIQCRCTMIKAKEQ